MLIITDKQKIHVYVDPVDMRKSINGLSSLLVDCFDRTPSSGDLYLFINKQKNKVKCLWWDTNGFVLYYKRLERGKFNYSKYLQGNEIVISQSQLFGLLRGLDFYLMSDDHGMSPQEFY